MNYIDPHALGLDVVKVVGHEARVICPFHDDHTPSASFNIKKGKFYCFACGAKSTAKRLAAELGGTNTSLHSPVTLRRREDDREWRPLLSGKLAFDSDYLYRRKITRKQIEHYGILELNDGSIGFPLHDPEGRITGLLARRTAIRGPSPRYILHGSRPVVWPAAEVGNSQSPILVEGIFGALRLRSAGYSGFATLGVGALSRVVDVFNGRTQAKVWFDNDFAGHVGAAKLLYSLGLSVVIPESKKGLDPDEASEGYIRGVLRYKDYFTRDFRLLGEGSGDKVRFWHLLRRWMKSQGTQVVNM